MNKQINNRFFFDACRVGSCSIIALLSLLCLSFKYVGNNVKDVSADKELKKIASWYGLNSKGDKKYVMIAHQNIVDGQIGEKLVAEIWVDGHKMKYSNPFLTVYQDEAVQVVISKESRRIVIRRAIQSPDSVSGNELPAMAQVDSLKKVATAITCSRFEKTGKLTIDLPAKINGHKGIIKQIVLEYAASTGEIKKGTYEYYISKGSKREIYEYVKRAGKFDNSILSGKALDKVFSGDKLLKEYKDYNVQNLLPPEKK